MIFITRHCLAFASCLATVALVHAAPVPDASNPDTPVPGASYQSVFKNYQTAPAALMRPDQVWLAPVAPATSEPDHGSMDMDMDMKMPMPTPMSGKDRAPPMDMHHGHGKEK